MGFPVDREGHKRHGLPEDGNNVVLDCEDGDVIADYSEDRSWRVCEESPTPEEPERMREFGREDALECIEQAGESPYNSDGELAMPERPTDEYIRLVRLALGREELTHVEREAYQEGFEGVVRPLLERAEEVGFAEAREELL